MYSELLISGLHLYFAPYSSLKIKKNSVSKTCIVVSVQENVCDFWAAVFKVCRSVWSPDVCLKHWSQICCYCWWHSSEWLSVVIQKHRSDTSSTYTTGSSCVKLYICVDQSTQHDITFTTFNFSNWQKYKEWTISNQIAACLLCMIQHDWWVDTVMFPHEASVWWW